jgi:hypothetical protein
MLARVHNAAQRPFDEINEVAVAITATGSDQRHVGIFHKDDAGRVMLLHLAWHFDLRNSEPKPYYAWVELPIHSARARQVAARCRQIFRANPRGLPYAFSPPNDCFDEKQSTYLFGPTRHGLTCATFVIAVFQTTGIRLVLDETWPVTRADDEVWKQKIITALQKSATPEHIEFIQAEAGSTRFRPEEVAGAAANSSIPVSFVDAEKLSVEILQKLVDDGLHN